MNEDKAARYHRLQRRVSLASLAWSVGFLLLLTVSGAAIAIRRGAEFLAGGGGPVTPVILFVAALLLLHEMGALLPAFYGGFVLERRYGLSAQSFRGWLADQVKAVGVLFVLGSVAASVVYGLMRSSPEWWWCLSGLVFAMLFAIMANLAPVVVLPLFYTIRPLDRAELAARLLALARRAGARVLGAYEWGLGDKSRKANAALAGIGSTRRILVSDTMLADYSDDEIEVVLAHELAHHVHGDIWKGLLFESALMLAGFYVSAQLLTRVGPRVGLRDAADIAGLPLLLLAAGAVSLLMLPVAHAMSRRHERRADRFALELTGNPGAFISAMRRLGRQNLAEDQPSAIVRWLFYSHPPLQERIAAAQAFVAGDAAHQQIP